MTSLTKKWMNTGLLDGFAEDECDKASPLLEQAAKDYIAGSFNSLAFNPQQIYDALKKLADYSRK